MIRHCFARTTGTHYTNTVQSHAGTFERTLLLDVRPKPVEALFLLDGKLSLSALMRLEVNTRQRQPGCSEATDDRAAHLTEPTYLGIGYLQLPSSIQNKCVHHCNQRTN